MLSDFFLLKFKLHDTADIINEHIYLDLDVLFHYPVLCIDSFETGESMPCLVCYQKRISPFTFQWIASFITDCLVPDLTMSLYNLFIKFGCVN